MKIRFRGVIVTIYRKTKKYPFYRLAYRGDGGRVVRNFKTLAEARKAAEDKARQLHAGNHVGASLPKAAAQAYRFAERKLAELSRDISAARDPAAPPLTPSLEDAITEYTEAKRALGPRRLIEAVTGFLGTVAQIRLVKVRAAVDEYQRERKLLTVPPAEGKRPALSPKFHYQDELRLGRFADAFQMDVADLAKDHLDLFFRNTWPDSAPNRATITGARCAGGSAFAWRATTCPPLTGCWRPTPCRMRRPTAATWRFTPRRNLPLSSATPTTPCAPPSSSARWPG